MTRTALTRDRRNHHFRRRSRGRNPARRRRWPAVGSPDRGPRGQARAHRPRGPARRPVRRRSDRHDPSSRDAQPAALRELRRLVRRHRRVDAPRPDSRPRPAGRDAAGHLDEPPRPCLPPGPADPALLDRRPGHRPRRRHRRAGRHPRGPGGRRDRGPGGREYRWRGYVRRQDDLGRQLARPRRHAGELAQRLLAPGPGSLPPLLAGPLGRLPPRREAAVHRTVRRLAGIAAMFSKFTARPEAPGIAAVPVVDRHTTP